MSLTGLLCLLPALLLAVLFWVRRGRRLPGERLLVRAVERARSLGRRARGAAIPPPRRDRRRAPAGGVLLGLSLAGRAPPTQR